MARYGLTILLLLVSACDGGSGGGLAYSGNTGQATLGFDNAANVAKYSCSSKKNINALLAWGESMLMLPGAGTYTGTCGGRVSITESANSGSIQFMTYCTTTSYGNVDVNGGVAGAIDNSGNFSLDINSLTLTLNDINFTMDGSAQGSPLSVVYNVVVRDNISAKMYKQENFVISPQGMRGRLFFSDYGYVDVSTPMAIIADATGNISQGEFRFEGANQNSVNIRFSAGNYTIGFTDNNGYQEVDTGVITDLCQ